jgi:hypothetical protein
MASLNLFVMFFLYTKVLETWYAPYYKFDEMHDGL